MSDIDKPPFMPVPDARPPKPSEMGKPHHRRWVVHSHEASRPSHVDAKSDINITPLIDVMLVLLIIFMVTAPILQQGVAVDLPKVAAGPLAGQEEQLVVNVSKGGQVFLNDTPMTADALTGKLRAIAAARPDR